MARRRRPARRRRGDPARRLRPRRLPARRARSPASRRSWGRSRELAARGGPVLGICNGFQVLTEAGLLPGALLRNARLRFRCHAWVDCGVERRVDTASRASRRATTLRMPIKHHDGSYFASPEDARRARARRPGAAALPPSNPNGSVGAHRRRHQRARATCGLMPHPEHAVDALLGLDRRPRAAARAARELARRPPRSLRSTRGAAASLERRHATAAARCLGLTDVEFERIQDCSARDRTTSSWPCSRDVERALLLQALAAAAATAAHRGQRVLRARARTPA